MDLPSQPLSWENVLLQPARGGRPVKCSGEGGEPEKRGPKEGQGGVCKTSTHKVTFLSRSSDSSEHAES